jgi:hypothetical protein
MTALEQLQSRLAAYPHLPCEVEGDALWIGPGSPDGFPVLFWDLGGQVQVTCGNGWHERFEDMDEAIECFLLGLSDRCRLRVTQAGSFEYRWTLERREGDSWLAVSTVGLFWWPFWRRKQARYLQNGWL